MGLYQEFKMAKFEYQKEEETMIEKMRGKKMLSKGREAAKDDDQAGI